MVLFCLGERFRDGLAHNRGASPAEVGPVARGHRPVSTARQPALRPQTRRSAPAVSTLGGLLPGRGHPRQLDGRGAAGGRTGGGNLFVKVGSGPAYTGRGAVKQGRDLLRGRVDVEGAVLPMGEGRAPLLPCSKKHGSPGSKGSLNLPRSSVNEPDARQLLWIRILTPPGILSGTFCTYFRATPGSSRCTVVG
jgi:hypothetical protein